MKKIILILIAVYLVIPSYSQKNNITQKKENVENLSFPSAIINDDNVRLRTEPNLYCDKICLLAKNTQVEIIKISKIFLNIDGKNFPWIKVRVIKDSKAVSGWVYGQYV
ncbi:MAG: SH3 domain-containing protein, partial [Treponema sp.]|nr:SH3 domain-containing protein [Treponema sp.]